MKKISIEEALSLVANRDEIHCFQANPLMTPGGILCGWSNTCEQAVESIQTSDELYLLDDKEAFCGHRLWCKNPKGQYPEKQLFMEA